MLHGVKPRPFPLKYEYEGRLPSFGHNELFEDSAYVRTQKAKNGRAFPRFHDSPRVGLGPWRSLWPSECGSNLVSMYNKEKEENHSDCTLLGIVYETDFSSL